MFIDIDTLAISFALGILNKFANCKYVFSTVSIICHAVPTADAQNIFGQNQQINNHQEQQNDHQEQQQDDQHQSQPHSPIMIINRSCKRT